jgi:hypothetical protein
MCRIFKVDRMLRLVATICIVLTICAPFAAVYAASWLNLVAATYAPES